MLKDKIKEYLILEFEDEVSVGRVKDIAQDIADIAEKEIDDTFIEMKEYEKLLIEKAKISGELNNLKQQLSSIKYLNRDEVEKIFLKINCFDATSHMKAVEKILKLALPDKDRVELELYKLYYHVIANCVPGNMLQRDKEYIESIASEIIGGK